jgi:hypothetical protein
VKKRAPRKNEQHSRHTLHLTSSVAEEMIAQWIRVAGDAQISYRLQRVANLLLCIRRVPWLLSDV